MLRKFASTFKFCTAGGYFRLPEDNPNSGILNLRSILPKSPKPNHRESESRIDGQSPGAETTRDVLSGPKLRSEPSNQVEIQGSSQRWDFMSNLNKEDGVQIAKTLPTLFEKNSEVYKILEESFNLQSLEAKQKGFIREQQKYLLTTIALPACFLLFFLMSSSAPLQNERSTEV